MKHEKVYLKIIVVLLGMVLLGCEIPSDDKMLSGDGSSLESAINVEINSWSNGNIPDEGEQWFKFISTNAIQYIHIAFDVATRVKVQLYDNNKNTLGNEETLMKEGGALFGTYISREVSIGQVYYIRVRTSGFALIGGYGEYRLGITNLPAKPKTTFHKLTSNIWDLKYINDDGNNYVQWFTFTADTNYLQYIHFKIWSMSLTNIYVSLYDSNGYLLGKEEHLHYDNSFRASWSLFSGNTYFLRVPYNDTYGWFQIAFNSSEIPPDVDMSF